MLFCILVDTNKIKNNFKDISPVFGILILNDSCFHKNGFFLNISMILKIFLKYTYNSKDSISIELYLSRDVAFHIIILKKN